MFNTIRALNTLLGTLVSLAILAALGFGGWFAYSTYRDYHGDKWALQQTEKHLEEREKDLAQKEEDIAQLNERLASSQHELDQRTKELVKRQKEIDHLGTQLAASQEHIESLNEELKAKQLQIEQLSAAIRLLKVDHRVAQIDVLSQEGSAEKGDLATRFSFTEVDESGKPLEGPRVFTIEGDVVHVAALVVKFADEHAEMGDPLRSTSLCLFKRIYGDKQQPEKGFVLDPVGSRPVVYDNGSQMSALEQEIWSKFWDYANDAEKAHKAWVRAAHGEAVFQKMRPGKRYKVLLRSSGGLTIIPEDRPPDGEG